MNSSLAPEEPEAISRSSTPVLSSELIAEDLRQFNRSPHPYHRSRRLGSRTPSDQGDRLRPHSYYSKSSRTPSDSGTEADDESTGILRGLPAPPVRPRKGLRSGGSTAVDSETWLPTLQPWTTFVRPTARGPRRSSEDEVGKAAEEKDLGRRRRVEVLRRLSETTLLLSVGAVTLLQRDARSLAWSWRKGTILIKLFKPRS